MASAPRSKRLLSKYKNTQIALRIDAGQTASLRRTPETSELSDCEWAAIKPMLPNKPRGVPRVNDRRVLNGIFWVLRSGAPWRDLPKAYGPRKAVDEFAGCVEYAPWITLALFEDNTE
jgi:hypothetical protein